MLLPGEWWGGGGGTLIFSHKRGLGPLLGFKFFNFNIIGFFQYFFFFFFFFFWGGWRGGGGV